ncbi:MAG: hypothetical protein DRN78_03960 [Thermoproteota archaeon]|nr:MAG: hypothetical protein DRN78_03960 [Candidatus Korarchaeota archaeon]
MKLVCKICGRQYESENPYSVACKECKEKFPELAKRIKEQRQVIRMASRGIFMDIWEMQFLDSLKGKIWSFIALLSVIGFILWFFFPYIIVILEALGVM